METADYIPLRALLNEDKGAMVKMLLGRMYVALGSQGDEEDDLAEWLKADDVSVDASDEGGWVSNQGVR